MLAFILRQQVIKIQKLHIKSGCEAEVKKKSLVISWTNASWDDSKKTISFLTDSDEEPWRDRCHNRYQNLPSSVCSQPLKPPVTEIIKLSVSIGTEPLLHTTSYFPYF